MKRSLKMLAVLSLFLTLPLVQVQAEGDEPAADNGEDTVLPADPDNEAETEAEKGAEEEQNSELQEGGVMLRSGSSDSNDEAASENESAGCSVMINDASGRDFTINCTGLSEEELNTFRAGMKSLSLTDPDGNTRLIYNLISTPIWGEGSVSMSVNAEQLRVSDAEYIPAGSIPDELQVNDYQNGVNLTYKLTVEEGSAAGTLGPIKTSLADKITVEETEAGTFAIKGDATVLNNLYNHTFQHQGDDYSEDLNNTTQIYLYSIDHQYNYSFPQGGDRDCMLEWHDSEAKDYLVFAVKMLTNHSVQESNYQIEISCNNADEFGYARTMFGGENGLHIAPPPLQTATTVKAVQQDDFSILISVEAGEEDFLQHINLIGLTDMEGRTGGTTIPESRIPVFVGDDPLTFETPATMMQGNYSQFDKPERLGVRIESGGYEPVVIELDPFKWPYKEISDTPYYVVTGDGVVIKSKDEAFADAVLSTEADCFGRFSSLSVSPDNNYRNNIFFMTGGSYEAYPYYIVTPQRISSENGVFADLIPIKYEQLEEAGITAFGKEDIYYLMQTAPYYKFAFSQGFTYSLSPIYAKYLIDQAAQEETPSVSELEEVDQAALEVDKEKLNNCTIEGSVNVDAAAAEFNVNVAGAIGGAVSDDLSTVFTDGKEPVITVDAAVKEGTSDLTVEEIEAATDLSNAELTDVKFDITLNKTYDTEPDKNGTVDELPFGAAVTFALPEEPAEGEQYTLVSEHNGEVLSYEVTVQEDGTGLAYVDKYSSFVLVKTAKPEEETEPVKPAEPSQGTTVKPVQSSVVTCQMAGYPEGYVWNEAAKACQAGYYDGAGTFRSGHRTVVVNTADPGLRSPFAGLISSSLVAVFAAYALKKWR